MLAIVNCLRALRSKHIAYSVCALELCVLVTSTSLLDVSADEKLVIVYLPITFVVSTLIS